MTPAVVAGITDRYIELYEHITGQKFVKSRFYPCAETNRRQCQRLSENFINQPLTVKRQGSARGPCFTYQPGKSLFHHKAGEIVAQKFFQFLGTHFYFKTSVFKESDISSFFARQP